MYCPHCGNKRKSADGEVCLYCGIAFQAAAQPWNTRQTTSISEDGLKDGASDAGHRVDFHGGTYAMLDKLDESMGIRHTAIRKELDTKRFDRSAWIVIGIAALGCVVVFLFHIIATIETSLFVGNISFFLISLTFYKLKMPVSLAVMAILMIMDKIYTAVFYIGRFSGVSMMIVFCLFLSAIQLIRARRMAPKLTFKKAALAVLLSLFFFIAPFIIFYPEIFQY